MKNIFVCYTIYHIYQSVLKTIDSEESCIIIITDYLDNYHLLFDRLIDSELFEKVLILHELEITNSLNNYNLFKKVIFRNQIIKSTFSKHIDMDLIKYNRIYIFLDTRYLSILIMDKNQFEIILMEDGKFTYMQPVLGFRDNLKNYVYGLDIPYGRNKKIRYLEVFSPELLPADIRKKSRKFEIKRIKNKLDAHQKKKIMSIFGNVGNVNFRTEKTILLITQPLSENNWISEDEKIKIYNDIIKNYGNGYKVILKKHPRERTNYSKFIHEDLHELPQEFPLELLDLDESLRFDIGITLDSSALYNLNNVNSKIFLGYEYNNKLKEVVSKIVKMDD